MLRDRVEYTLEKGDLERACLEAAVLLAEPGLPEEKQIPRYHQQTKLLLLRFVQFSNSIPCRKNAIPHLSDSRAGGTKTSPSCSASVVARVLRGGVPVCTGLCAMGTLESSAGCQRIGLLPIPPHASWVKNRENECRQGGNREFGMWYAKRCPVERVCPSGAALRSSGAGGQVGSSAVRAVMPKNNLFIVSNRYLTRCQRRRHRTRSCSYPARRARTRSLPPAASAR